MNHIDETIRLIDEALGQTANEQRVIMPAEQRVSVTDDEQRVTMTDDETRKLIRALAKHRYFETAGDYTTGWGGRLAWVEYLATTARSLEMTHDELTVWQRIHNKKG